MVILRFVAVLTLFLPVSALNAQRVKRLNNHPISETTLTKKIQALVTAANVHGLGISIFNDNKVVYKKVFGYKNAGTKEPLTLTGNFYGASLSKAVFAVLVMKLVEEGKLELDKPLYEYLPIPIYDYVPATKWHDNYADFKHDPNYKKLTARICLSHTTGLPNWRWDNADERLRFINPPGVKYGYSGEGLVYLQVVLEKMLNQPLEQLMQEYIFKRAGMTMSSYTWQPRFEKDYAIGHNKDGRLYEKDKDNEARSASTLETSLEDYTRFTNAVLNNLIIMPSSRSLMFTPQVRLRSIQQFGPQRLKDSTLNDAINLSYGLGWVLLKSPHGTGAFKEGHGDGFQHYNIVYPDKGTAIIILSNSDNAESIFKELLELAIGDVYTPWYWENYIPYNFKKSE